MSQLTPHVSEFEHSTGFDGRELAISEVTGDEVGTNVFPILFRICRYPRFARRITRATHCGSVAVRSGAPAIPDDGMARRARLRHLQTLAKLYGVD